MAHPRAGTPRRRGTRPRAGVGAAHAGAVRRRPPAPRPRRLPAGAASACRVVRTRARPRTPRPGAQDPRSGSGAGRRRRALAPCRPPCARLARSSAGSPSSPGSTETWDDARRGSGQLGVVLGPVDCGRTRLVGELASAVIADGGWVEYVRGGGLARRSPDPVPARSSTRSPIAAAAARCCSSSTTPSGCRRRLSPRSRRSPPPPSS